jgi:hypothetical protein
MFARTPIDPEQPPLDLSSAAALDAEVERRVAARSQSDAMLWRFRLIMAETLMMGLLVAVAGLALHQAPLLVARAALLVSGSCLATGMLLLWLSSVWLRLAARLRKGRRA